VIWYRRDEIKPTGMSFALAVNDHGHMVGEGVDDSDGFNRTMLWKDGGRVVLPALPGSKDKRTSAEASNNKGQVVGGSSYGSNGAPATSWRVPGASPTAELSLRTQRPTTARPPNGPSA
jgi:uncharacterized membrane protein